MKVELICKECGHKEEGTSDRMLMAKIRMWNHLNRKHPELVDAFREIVETK